VVEIRNMTEAKVEAEVKISECLKQLASEEEMLVSLLAQSSANTNGEYLKASKKACRLGIKAWKLSISAYRYDIETYNAKIGDILMCVPDAMRDN
jgi:hypothetical protein